MIIEKDKNNLTRGERKIAFAAQRLSVDFDDKIVLDVGSSTGGFTKFALDNGAGKVIAVEKGSHQMRPEIARLPWVSLHENTDVFDLTGKEKWGSKVYASRALLEDPGASYLYIKDWTKEIDIVVADVSFVSLKKVLRKLKSILPRRVEYLVMMKPQFEAKENQLNRGVVKNERIRREIIRDFEIWLKENKFFIQGKCDNELAGRKGNLERFYYLKLSG